MPYLIAVAATLGLLIGFLLLTVYETKSGFRILGASRAKLDTSVSRLWFIVKHVDLMSFAFHLVRDGFSHLVHLIAHLSLVAVRSIERALTRLVRYLRGRHAARNGGPLTSAHSTSTFVETIAYFKHTLKRSRVAPPATPAPETTPGGEVE